ncbi:recombinase family protein [Nocardia sp. NPDC001965]
MTDTLSGLRAVVAARVSHVQGAEKTSHHTQTDKGVSLAVAQSWDVVGLVEDLDVSAIKLGPWERPDLKQWLTDRRHEFDVLIFAKTDRVFRRADDSFELTKWAKENRKILVLVDDGIRIDFYTPEEKQDPMTAMMSRMFLFMASFFAEMEGRRFLQRAQDRVGYLRGTDRWGYGIPPFGFAVVDHRSGEGKSLAHDLDAQKILHEIANRLLSDHSLTRIAADLNTAETLSPQDWVRVRAGKPSKGTRWTTRRVKAILTSPATQGVKMAGDKPVLDIEGSPVMVGPPSFDSETWARIQDEVSSRTQNPRERRHSLNPMLGVGKCYYCTKNLRQRSQTTPGGVTHRYFVCGNSPRPCPGVSIIADQAETLVEEGFLEVHAGRRIMQRVWRNGSDHSHELDQVVKTIESLREDRAMGLFTTDADQEMFRTQMKSLVARRDALSELPVIKAGWAEVETDKTYGEVWPTSAPEERRTLLVDAGVRLVVRAPNDWSLKIDLDRALGEGLTGKDLLDQITG